MAKKKSDRSNNKKTIATITHGEATRKNIPTAEYQSVMRKEELTPLRIAYDRRNRDLDPQLVWRGKDEQDWSDLVVHAPPLYIQEKVHPKVLIDDLVQQTEKQAEPKQQLNLFSDFNGLPSENAKTEFYQHDANWSNRMILGDSLQVMASLAEREGLRGKVQCIFIDPPYGIKFNSNFQWSTTSRDVKDGNMDHITREPEQVKAFRDTWRDGIHSYLTYLRDRLTISRDLLTNSGSIFVQIGDENLHRVRSLMDEVFGDRNFISVIAFRKTGATSANLLDSNNDYILWYSSDIEKTKFRPILKTKSVGGEGATEYKIAMLPNLLERPLTKEELEDISILNENIKIFTLTSVVSDGKSANPQELNIFGKVYTPGTNEHWKTTVDGMQRLFKAGRLSQATTKRMYKRFFNDYPAFSINNNWQDVRGALNKVYVVQTAQAVIERCIIMTTDPGDLVIDPTCGSGTTAYVAEQWGRRWITIDTSRVALALARARIMGARFPYYFLADSRDGQLKEAEISNQPASESPTHGDIRQGFVYERIPHITLKSIANNTEIDVIWEKHQSKLEPIRANLNKLLKEKWEEWEIPREKNEKWSKEAKQVLDEYWKSRIERQRDMDHSITAKADYEYLYDKPYEDKKKVRVAGPFTVESLSPHRVLAVDENDELIEQRQDEKADDTTSFVKMILDNLQTSGVQQAHKEDKITFSSIASWPGYFICGEGRYIEGDMDMGAEKRAAIFIGPEFGTVSRPDLVAAAREAGDAAFDVLVTCAFNYDAHSSEFNKLGRIPVLKARMNADLHMANDLKNTGKGNLFVIFGEPDIDIISSKDGKVQVKINGVDVFHPNTGEVISDSADGIACWFIDTDYNEESFFVRHAYFLGANDPYKALKTTLKAEINEDAWSTLNSDISRPFDKPESGRIAVKVINHLGDEVMKVFKVA